MAGDCGVHCSHETGAINNVSCPGRHHSGVLLIVALLHADINFNAYIYSCSSRFKYCREN